MNHRDRHSGTMPEHPDKQFAEIMALLPYGALAPLLRDAISLCRSEAHAWTPKETRAYLLASGKRDGEIHRIPRRHPS